MDEENFRIRIFYLTNVFETFNIKRKMNPVIHHGWKMKVQKGRQ